MSKLTNRAIERAEILPKTQLLADGDGLYLRIEPNGTKTFCFRYTYAGRRKLMALEPYPVMDVAGAREKVIELKKLLASDKDPLALAEEKRQELKQTVTVQALSEEWMTRFIKQRYSRPEKEQHFLESDVLPVIGKALVTEITPRHVAHVIGKILDRKAPTKANRVLSVMRSLFSYAVQHGYLATSPVMMTKKGAGGAERPRSRVLSAEEIKLLWLLLDARKNRKNWRAKIALKLVLATAQRPGEVCGMEWSHVDLKAGIWSLPAEITKSRRSHIVHLSDLAVSLLEDAHTLTGGQRYVFRGYGSDGAQALTVSALTQYVARAHKAGKLGKMARWTPHDLRRTASTQMANHGVYPHVTEKILNHSMKGVLAVYNLGEYLPERKAALEMWGGLIERWVS